LAVNDSASMMYVIVRISIQRGPLT
jgi:hypothetical protein